MNQVKRISTELSIFAATLGDPTTITVGQAVPNNAEVTINGNLRVRGTTTTVNTVDMAVADNIITLNSDVVGTPAENAGIEINRGTELPVSVLWNEGIDRWQLTNDGVNFYNISTQQGGSYLSAVVEDLDPHLGGNLTVNGFSIGSDTVISLTAPLLLTKETGEISQSVASTETLVYAAETTGGGTGIYALDSAGNTNEMVSKKKAIIYSLIF